MSHGTNNRIAEQTALCGALINHDRYPLNHPGDPHYAAAVTQVQNQLAEDGCAVIKGFLSSRGLATLLGECQARRAGAHFSPSIRTNVYFSGDDPTLPEDHPRRILLERSNGFVTSDLFGAETTARRLYLWPPLEHASSPTASAGRNCSSTTIRFRT